jgi:uncharacterized protein YbdZ (MbtH family)
MSTDPAGVYERQQQLVAGVWVAGEYHHCVGVYVFAVLQGVESARVWEEGSAVSESWAAVCGLDYYGSCLDHLAYFWYVYRWLRLLDDEARAQQRATTDMISNSRLRCVCEGQLHRLGFLDLLSESGHLCW